MKDVKYVCKFCGEDSTDGAKGYCQACYNYFVRNKKVVYNTPAYGEILYTETGDVVCPICGMAYVKVMQHIYYKHSICAKDAFVKFGWHKYTTKATNEKYRVHMNKVQDPKTIEENLLVKGTDTRFEKGIVFNRDATHYKKVKVDKLEPVNLVDITNKDGLAGLRKAFDSKKVNVDCSEESDDK